MMHHVAPPRAHFSPTIQHGNRFNAVRSCPLDVLIQGTKFVGYVGNVVHKIGKLKRKFQVTSVPDTVDRLTQQSSPRRYPIYFRFLYGVSTRMKRIGKKIRQKTAFGIPHTGNITDKAKRASVSDTADNRIKTNRFKLFQKRFGSYPMVA